MTERIDAGCCIADQPAGKSDWRGRTRAEIPTPALLVDLTALKPT